MITVDYAFDDFRPRLEQTLAGDQFHCGNSSFAKDIVYDFQELFNQTLNSTRWGRAIKVSGETEDSRENFPGSAQQVLETFTGHVDAIQKGWAFVTLRDPYGEILNGRYSATDLAKQGIGEGCRFECSTIKIGPNQVRISYRPLPSLSGTPEALRIVRERLSLTLDDENFIEDP
jgi:hypothetical protein